MSNKAALETTRTPAIPFWRDGEDTFYVEVAQRIDGGERVDGESSNNKLGEAAITSILRCPKGGELKIPFTALEPFIASAEECGVQSSVDLGDPNLGLGRPRVEGVVPDPHLDDYLNRLAVQQPLDITRLLPQGGSGSDSNVGNAQPELPSLAVPKEWSQEPDKGEGAKRVVWPFDWAQKAIRHNPNDQSLFIDEAQRLLTEGTEIGAVDLHTAALYLGALGGKDTYELWQELSGALRPLNREPGKEYFDSVLDSVLAGVKEQLDIAAIEQGDPQRLKVRSEELSRGIGAAAGMVSEKVRSVLSACFIGHLTRHCNRLPGAEATVTNMQQALYGQLSRW
ncbi:MAG: hypothetical protein Q4B05_02630 [Candidatus Saccharibacteria bacterium]|nr:hypothetical protein [Candidatus Saccharibacteria bacterium]